jgi:DinB superfamily
VLRAIPFDVNDADTRGAFLRRGLFEALAALRANARPQWGRMTAQQMIEHLLWAFELSTGEAQTECPVPEPQRKRAKAFLYDNRPTPREFINPVLAVGLPPLRHDGLTDAVANLRAAVNRFLQQAASTPETTRNHPVFGPIGMDEWARAHFKHTYHHLLQFGLLDADA